MKKSKKKRKQAQAEEPVTVTRNFSLWGWVVLLAPLSIVLFLLLFGGSLPFLVEQSSDEAEDVASMLTQYGRAQMKAGQIQSALASFVKAVETKPNFAEAYIDIAQVYYIGGDIPRAVKWLESALALDPPQKDLVYNNLGLLHAKSGDFQTALAMFEKALSSGMESGSVYGNIGNVYLSLKNNEKAIEAYRNACKHRTTLKSIYSEMLKKALDEYRDDADNVELYATIKSQLDRGLSDEDVSAYDSLSILYYGQDLNEQAKRAQNLAMALEISGNYAEAVKYFEETVKLNPNSPTALYRLGGIYLKSRQAEAAKRYLEQALRLDPNHKMARSALKVAEKLLEAEKQIEQ